MRHPHILFVCTEGRLRSRTAHALRSEMGRASDYGGVGSAAKPAHRPITASMVRAADLIVCMEREHAHALRARFAQDVGETPVFTAAIPDEFDFMDPALVRQLRLLMGGLDRRQAPERRAARGAASPQERIRSISDHAYDRYLALRRLDEQRAEHYRMRFSRFYQMLTEHQASSIYITP